MAAGIMYNATKKSVVTTTKPRRKYRSKYKSKRNLRRLGDKLSVVMGEKKYFIDQVGQQSVISTGNIAAASLVDVPQGTADTNRDGDQITLTSIQIKYYLQISFTTATELINYVRVIYFQYFPYIGGGAPAVTDILLTADFRAPYNHDKRFDFHILHDKTHMLTAQATGVPNDSSIRKEEFYLTKFKRRKVQFTAAGVNGSNKVWILYISDSGVIPHPLIQYYHKTNFKDA